MKVNLCSDCITALKAKGYRPFVGNPSTACTCDMCESTPETGTVDCSINRHQWIFASADFGYINLDEIWGD